MTADTLPAWAYRPNANPSDLGQPVLTKLGNLWVCVSWAIETISGGSEQPRALTLAATASLMGLVMLVLFITVGLKTMALEGLGPSLTFGWGASISLLVWLWTPIIAPLFTLPRHSP